MCFGPKVKKITGSFNQSIKIISQLNFVILFLESLEEILMEAIIEEKVEFVAMILQQTVVMKEFLTRKRLQTLYEKVS